MSRRRLGAVGLMLRMAGTGMLSVCLSGCFMVTWQPYYSSAPTLLPSGSWTQAEDGTFASSDLKVRLEAYNGVFGREGTAALFLVLPVLVPDTRGSGPPAPPPFKISVLFDSAGGYTFDPSRVILTGDTIPSMPPGRVDALTTSVVDWPIPLEPQPAIYLLVFDTAPPDPARESFSLVLGGLTRGDVPIAALQIRFKPQQARRVLHHYP